MSLTRSRSTAQCENALSIYSAQLESYAKTYMVSFDGSESVEDWVSRHAQRFASVNNYVPLAVITRDLSEYVSKKVNRYSPWSQGRSQFHKFLLSEYETWYSAFEAEADDEGLDSSSAAARWVYHCAKKLSRTGLSAEALVPVVEAWLTIHNS
jgi:hypothetical protein